MWDETDRPEEKEATDASVGYGGEPHGSADTRDVTPEEGAGPTPEELDAREERFTGPRKPMGPEKEAEVPETIPDEQ
jgi:hypothetical protein